MTPEELAAIDARLEAAKGPVVSRIMDDEARAADIDLIAHAPEDLRRLRAEVERLRTYTLTRADVEAALRRADVQRVRDATCDLIEADGPDTTREAEDRRIVELVCAVLGVPRG